MYILNSISFAFRHKFTSTTRSHSSRSRVRNHTSGEQGLFEVHLNMFNQFRNLKQASSILAAFRKYATHREIGNRFAPSSYGWSSSSRGKGWNFWWKPVAFTAGVIAFDQYILPPIVESQALSSFTRNPKNAVYGIIALNALGFFAWRMPGFPQQFMYKYGLLQKFPTSFRGFQLIGSAFSHQNFWHFAINNFVLYQFAGPVSAIMGTAGFLGFYLNSCALSSLGSMVLPFLLRRPQLLPSLGASGAVFSCLGVFCYLFPDAKLALWFIPLPIGAWNVYLLTIAFNVFSALRNPAFLMGGGVDYAGHIAGSLCGIGYGKIVKDKIDERRRKFQSRFGF